MVTSHRTTRPITKFGLFLVMALLLVFTTSAQAVLFRVGPNNVPSPPGNGFPLWYQDTNGLALDLCLPRNPAQLAAGVCLITTPANDPLAGMNLPFVFPTNFPGEAFWFAADAVGDLNANGDQAVLVLALEAAFGTENAAVGGQISFGRIRIRVDAPVAGTYTVTHPYGVQVFPNVAAGSMINETSDIGIGSPGDFTGALQSGIGPFLKASATPGGAALPPVTIPGDPSGDQFLSSAGAPVFVTGSPQNTNYFEVCVDAGTLDGVNACKRFDQFILVGKVHTAPIPSPFVVNSATYSRDALGAQVDVTATATAGPFAATPKLSFGDAATTNLIPSTLMNGPTVLGQFFGQAIPTTAALPASIIVTNSGDVPPASIKQALTDVVTVTQAAYNPATGALTITATSSDKVAPPQLTAIGLPGAGVNVDVPLVAAPTTDPAVQQVVFTLPAVGALRVPPPSVTVSSAKGGTGTLPVSAVAAPVGTFPAGGPIAINDAAAPVPVADVRTRIPINVLKNDTNNPVPASIRIVTPPKKGTVALAPATGTLVYTFTGAKVVGNDTFTYTVKNAAGVTSNVATVLVKIVP